MSLFGQRKAASVKSSLAKRAKTLRNQIKNLGPALKPNCYPISCETNKTIQSLGFTLIELITVIAGLALLTSISATALINIFSGLENDEVQAHLNSLAADCLRIHANNTDSKGDMPSSTAVDNNLLDKNNYEENTGNSCKYFQINPKNTNSKTHFTMGFGIANGKVTKFAIKDSGDTSDIVTACKSWAGEGNCLENGSNYSAFFTHMDEVRIERATCIIDLNNYLNTTPAPTNEGGKNTWDSNADIDCKNKTLPTNEDSYNTANCKTDGCTKKVFIKDGKIVGYNESDFNQAETLECQTSISSYINSDSYNGGAETKTDLTGCTGEKYICNYNEHSVESYENCKIEVAILACKRDLENKRLTTTGTITVTGEGLPPCGQKYCVSDNKVVSEGPCP